ncbi:hypothetical protein J5N97_005330 [Dioscorea zingiberensis]|uniref:Uncharacterized protein n=1 Tax=Dioscorea zingiberensis TaxID=325984 RepID=A0A9D5HS89_9LILI|nr:hypothetical protein J5N97_005330 [Dioscorea zingiberensis]
MSSIVAGDDPNPTAATREKLMELGEAPASTPQTVPELIARVAAETRALAPEKTKARTTAIVNAAVSKIVVARSDAPL